MPKENLAFKAIVLTTLLGIAVMLNHTVDKRIIKPNIFPIRNSLYSQTSSLANTNGDNITDHHEWEKVYEELGIPYDVHRSHPFYELSKRQMRRYIDNHSSR